MADPPKLSQPVSPRQMAELVARAWADETFKRRLVDQPAQVLRECGVDVPPNTEVRVVEPPENVLYFVLPPRPSDVTELTEGDLKAVAGGIIAVLIDGGPTTMSGPSCLACAFF